MFLGRLVGFVDVDLLYVVGLLLEQVSREHLLEAKVLETAAPIDGLCHWSIWISVNKVKFHCRYPAGVDHVS